MWPFGLEKGKVSSLIFRANKKIVVAAAGLLYVLIP
jgi:hypothetical protein